MGYQALLFCPDEKTARTVTQVLTELEFSVEPCTEAFAAVKKLMGGHFDAVVVDCDNEQNAALLFKSAKNSTTSQASLAVAVVEGQTGVAKAFRIGANLVLTKPINVEQAKGTLRVARGLLRKGDPAKAAGPAAPAPPTAPVQAAPTISAKAVPPLGSTAPQRPIGFPPVTKLPPPGASPGQAAGAKITVPSPVAKIPPPIEADLLAIELDDDAALPPVAAPAFNPIATPTEATKATPAAMHPGAGAASAPAPARMAETQAEPVVAAASFSNVAAPNLDHAEKHSDFAVPPSTFTFGGANAPTEPSGGSKKAFIGVAAALVVVGGLYFAWTQFQGKASSQAPVAQQAAPSNPAPPQTSQASKPQPASAPSSSLSLTTASNPLTASPAAQPSSSAATAEQEFNNAGGDAPIEKGATAKNGPKGMKPASATASKPPVESSPDTEQQPASQPISIKSGSQSPPPAKSQPVIEAPAPSVLGSTTPGSGSGLPNLVASSSGPKPILQTLNVSQGVSQGLLIKKVQPNYPSTALHMRVEGAVQLMATIGKSGNITTVKVLSGEPILAQAAQDAVKQWKYKPYFLNGEPVEIQTQVTVNFKLPR
jgi:TonB family protein